MTDFDQAMKRPKNYHQLPSASQWNIDEKLGILDWDGSCEHQKGQLCQECFEKYKDTHKME